MDYFCNINNKINIQDLKLFTQQDKITILTSRLKARGYQNPDLVVAKFVENKIFNELLNVKTPLIACISSKFHVICLEILVGAGLNLFEKDELSRTPLHIAACHANTRAMEILYNIRSGININAKDSYGQNPLHLIGDFAGDFSKNEEKITNAADWLIKNGIDLAAESDKNTCNFTPLHKAVACNRDALVKLMLSKGVSPSIKNSLGETPLHIAALHGSRKAMEVLLQNNADINAKDNENNTPLMYALMGLTSSPEAEYLIKMGAEVNTINTRGHTALYYALNTGKRESFDLIRTKVSIQREIQNGIPLILGACHKARLCIIEEIIAKEGNVFQIDKLGQSALHLAVIGNTKDIVEYLVRKCKLDVNLKDGKGMTPLHHAVESLSVDKVQLLLDLGADPAIQDNNGLNVYDLVLHLSATMPMFPQEILSLLIADKL